MTLKATTNPQTTQLLTTITRIAFTSYSTEGACVDTFEYCGANPQILALSCSDSDIRKQCKKTCGDCGTYNDNMILFRLIDGV